MVKNEVAMIIIYAINYFFSRVFLFKVRKTVLHITNLRNMNNLELITYLIVDLMLHFPCGAVCILEKENVEVTDLCP